MVNMLPKNPIERGIAKQIKKVIAFGIRFFFVMDANYFELTTDLIKCLLVK